MSRQLISAQIEHGHNEARLRDQANRITAGIAWLFACAISSLSFCVMGWTAARCTLHVPHWQIYGLMLAAIVQFAFAIVALFKGLDDLFYQKNDRRRLMRRSND